MLRLVTRGGMRLHANFTTAGTEAHATAAYNATLAADPSYMRLGLRQIHAFPTATDSCIPHCIQCTLLADDRCTDDGCPVLQV
jgi:hypothetical protein